MKAATRLVVRQQAKPRETAGLRAFRAQSADAFSGDRFLGQQLPLSLAPYRLQAADRWWRENGAAEDTPGRKRSA